MIWLFLFTLLFVLCELYALLYPEEYWQRVYKKTVDDPNFNRE